MPATTTFQPPNSSVFLITTKTSEMNSTTTPDPHQTCVDYESLQSPLAVLYSIFFVLGLVGNIVALWVFFCIDSKKNSVRVFLINVAFADLLLVVCLPFRILYHSQGNIWNLGPTMCKVVGNLFYMNMYISITLLGFISVDRYLKIHRRTGVQQRLRSTRWSMALCVAIWIVGLALTLVFLTSKNDSQLTRFVKPIIKLSYILIHFVIWAFWANIMCLLSPDVSTTSCSIVQSGRPISISFWWLSSGSFSSLLWCVMERLP